MIRMIITIAYERGRNGENSVYVSMGSDNSPIEIPKPNTHLPIIGRKSTKFQENPTKDVGVVGTRSRWTDGRTE